MKFCLVLQDEIFIACAKDFTYSNSLSQVLPMESNGFVFRVTGAANCWPGRFFLFTNIPSFQAMEVGFV